MQKAIKSRIIPTLKLLFAGGLITWLIKSGRLDFGEMKALLHPGFIAVATIMTLANNLIASERWRGILKSQNFTPTSWETMKLTLVGLFFNFVIPGGVGGDVVKGYYVARENPNDRLRSVVTIAMDRLLGLFSMLLIALLVMCYDWTRVSSSKQLLSIFIFLSSVFVSFVVFWVLIYSRRLVDSGWIHRLLHKLPKAEKTLKLYNSFADYKEAKKTFFRAVLWSLLGQSISILLFVFIGYWLGYTNVSFHTYFFVVPIGLMITAIPISPAGVGVGQAAFSYLFNATLNESSKIGASTITAVQIINFALGLVGALIYVNMGRKLKETPV